MATHQPSQPPHASSHGLRARDLASLLDGGLLVCVENGWCSRAQRVCARVTGKTHTTTRGCLLDGQTSTPPPLGARCLAPREERSEHRERETPFVHVGPGGLSVSRLSLCGVVSLPVCLSTLSRCDPVHRRSSYYRSLLAPPCDGRSPSHSFASPLTHIASPVGAPLSRLRRPPLLALPTHPPHKGKHSLSHFG